MSLDFRLKNIKDWESVCYFTDEETGQQKLNPVTQILTFCALAIGLQEITENNIDEWEVRLEILSQIGNYMGVMPDDAGVLKDWNPGRAELEQHLGLWTNCFPDLTRHKFKVQVMKRVEQDAVRAIGLRRDKLQECRKCGGLTDEGYPHDCDEDQPNEED